jgi:phosphatidylserine/phosphatidylglycerophosphate/cardiolipin synthase-like enzyme
MRLILLIINTGILVILGVLAQDNLKAKLEDFVPPAHAPHGTIEVVFSPNSNACATIIKAISQAKKSILVSAYSFTSKDIAQALLDAKKRHVSVKIILDKSQVSQRYSSGTFFANQKFDLHIDIKHAIFHNKVMIIDDITVITGSYNFTKAAETKNAENLLIIRDNPQLAKLYTENWRFHWNQSISWQEFLQKKARDKNITSSSSSKTNMIRRQEIKDEIRLDM